MSRKPLIIVAGLERAMSATDGIVVYRVPAVGEGWGPVEWWSA